MTKRRCDPFKLVSCGTDELWVTAQFETDALGCWFVSGVGFFCIAYNMLELFE